MNVLLVEDDPTDSKLLSAVLNSSGCHVLEKASAEQALGEISGHSLDVIVLDLKLPGMGGLELVRLLKTDPSTSHIPVIAITAAPEKFSREAALAAGCDAYITKPVDTRQLPHQVMNASAHNGARRQAASP